MSNSTHASTTKSKAKVFISYSRKDMAFADRLDAALKARGFEVLIDRTEIYAFEDWWQRIEALIGRADTIVFVLSPDAVLSDVALKEVAYGATQNKRFAPIVARPVEDGTAPETLRRLNFIFFDDPDRFEISADRLAEALLHRHRLDQTAYRVWRGCAALGCCTPPGRTLAALTLIGGSRALDSGTATRRAGSD